MWIVVVGALAWASDVSVTMNSARWSPLRVRARTVPAAPPGLVADARCVLRVEVDARGRPSSVRPVRCDPSIEAESVRAAWEWRFARSRAPAETELRVVMKVG